MNTKSTFDYRVVGLFSTPNEILDEIVSHLGAVDQVSVMTTCTLLHTLTSRRLYRHINILSALQARCLLETLINSHAGYAVHTRTLCYGSDRAYYTYTFHKLLVKALQRLEGLVHLSLDVQSTAFFDDFLIKKSIGPEFGFLVEPGPMSKRSNSLVSFQLCGDMRLLGIGAFHTITKMRLANKLTSSDLELLLDAMAPAGQNTVLKDLKLTLEATSPERHVTSTLRQVSSRCPNLEVFELHAPRVNTLETTYTLTLKPPLLPKLRKLSMNVATLVSPYFETGCQEMLLDQQQDHLTAAHILRPCLVDVGFGAVKWTKRSEWSPWTVSIERTTQDKLDEFRQFPAGIGFQQLFWIVLYKLEAAQSGPSS